MSNSEFKFCPRCGAVTKNLICDNCGFDMNPVSDTVKDNEENYTIFDTDDSLANEEFEIKIKKKRKNLWWVYALIAVSIVFVITLIAILGACVIVFLPTSGFNSLFGNNQPVVVPSPVPTPVNVLSEEENEEDAEEEEEDYFSEVIKASGFNVIDYDYDELQEYLLLANENTDVVSDEKGDYFYSDYYVMATGKVHEPMTKDDFIKPYFEYLADMYSDDYDYTYERRYVRVEGQYDGVYCNLYGAYYVFDSDTKDFTDVNDELKKRVYQNLYTFISDVPDYLDTNNYTAYADSYITFNNDEIISVVYDCYSYLGVDMQNIYYSSINIDVKNVTVLDNNKLVDIDDDFVEFFVDRSNIQNQYVYNLNVNDTLDIKKTFEDPTGLILFFTPVGMEIGINYRYGYTYGWITITLNDFDEYLTDEFEFDTSFSEDFDEFEYERINGIVYDDIVVYGAED